MDKTIEIKNCPLIKDAILETNGITIIAGENGTGKTKILKFLHCLNVEKLEQDFISIKNNLQSKIDSPKKCLESLKIKVDLFNKYMPEFICGTNKYKTSSHLQFIEIYRSIKAGVLSKSIILLDNPENNLHPLWTFKMALMLYKAVELLDVKIVLTTNSSLFVNSMFIFDEKHKTDFCRFYTLNKTENGSILQHHVGEDGINDMLERFNDGYRDLDKYEDGE